MAIDLPDMISIEVNAVNEVLFHKRRVAAFPHTNRVSSELNLVIHTKWGISFNMSRWP